MKPFEYDLEGMNDMFMEMLELVKDQIHLTKEALLTSDRELSTEIMRKEKRVNAFEISIDRECEDFLALQTPVASDLRFTMAVLKMSSSLERIGDHAFKISSFVFDDLMTINKELVELLQLPTIFDDIDDMLTNVSESFINGDKKTAKKVFKQDKVIDSIYKKLPKLLEDYSKKHPKADLGNLFLLSRTVGKLERVGDLAKNMAEEIIFYHDSKIIKHKKKNKFIEKKLKKAEEELK